MLSDCPVEPLSPDDAECDVELDSDVPDDCEYPTLVPSVEPALQLVPLESLLFCPPLMPTPNRLTLAPDELPWDDPWFDPVDELEDCEEPSL